MAIYKSINSPARGTASLRGVLRYVLDNKKTEGRLCLVTGYYDELMITPRAVFRSFQDVKSEWSKESDGRQYAHNVISFHADEQITPEQVLAFAQRFAVHVYPDHQTLIAVHTDKDHLHAHMIVNTVNYMDGSKLHKSKRDLENDKKFCNTLCRKYGLHVEEKGRRFDGSKRNKGEFSVWDKNLYRQLKENKDKSYIHACALASIKALKTARDKEDYIQSMAKLGWAVNWSEKRKHISYTDSAGHRVRDTKLAQSFAGYPDKEAMERQLKHNREKQMSRTR